MNKAERTEIIRRISNRLGIPDAAWLDALINFETAGTYDPKIKNKNSSARGLIQVIDSTAEGLFGMSSLELVNKYPDFESQMENVVYPYLDRYRPFPTRQHLYMAVFYPAYRAADPYKQFPQWVKKANPGIDTVQDYIDFVDARINQDTMHFELKPIHGLALAGIVALGGLAWFILRGGL